MPHHGKRYRELAQLVDRAQVYSPDAAMGLLKETAKVNFDPSVEAHIRLGVDPRHADQMVRGTVVLPHGMGKKVRVVVFAQGDKGQEALRRAPTRWAARTSSSASRRAGWSSMSPWRRRT